MGLTEAVQTEHIAIFEAIERQASQEARAAAERHLLNASARLGALHEGHLSRRPAIRG